MYQISPNCLNPKWTPHRSKPCKFFKNLHINLCVQILVERRYNHIHNLQSITGRLREVLHCKACIISHNFIYLITIHFLLVTRHGYLGQCKNHRSKHTLIRNIIHLDCNLTNQFYVVTTTE